MTILDGTQHQGVVVEHVAGILNELELFGQVLLVCFDPGLHVVHEHPDLTFRTVHHQQFRSFRIPCHQGIMGIDLVLIVENACFQEDLTLV